MTSQDHQISILRTLLLSSAAVLLLSFASIWFFAPFLEWRVIVAAVLPLFIGLLVRSLWETLQRFDGLIPALVVVVLATIAYSVTALVVVPLFVPVSSLVLEAPTKEFAIRFQGNLRPPVFAIVYGSAGLAWPTQVDNDGHSWSARLPTVTPGFNYRVEIEQADEHAAKTLSGLIEENRLNQYRGVPIDRLPARGVIKVNPPLALRNTGNSR